MASNSPAIIQDGIIQSGIMTNISLMGSSNIWTNMPAVLTELFGISHKRTKVDLSLMSLVRFMCWVEFAGAAGAVLRCEFSTDLVTWYSLAEISIAAPGMIASAWAAIPAGAKGDVILRTVGVGGDGIADPLVGLLALQVK